MRTNILGFGLGALLLTLGVAAEAQQAIFLVRHGETVAPKGTDLRPLSEAGQRRAVLLAKLLNDAGINAIFTSELERTIKTAEPLAQSLRIEPKALRNSMSPLRRKKLMPSSAFSEASIVGISYCL